MTVSLMTARLMPDLPHTPLQARLLRLSYPMAALGAGLAVPLLALGPATMAGTMVILVAALMVAASCDRGALIKNTADHAFTLVGGAVLFVFACWLISALGSFEPGRSLEKWGRTLIFIPLAVMLYHHLSADRKALELGLRTLLIVTLLCGIFVLLCRYYRPVTPDFLKYSFTGDLFKILKSYGSAAACLIPVTLVAGISQGGIWRWLGLACVPVLVGVIYMVESRAGVLGLGGGAFILFVWWLVRNLPHRLAWGAVILIMALSSWSIINRLPSPPITNDTSFEIPFSLIDQHRQIIWGFTLEKAEAAPWFGHGPDLINRLPGANIKIPNFNQQYIPAHPHNWAIEIFAETGRVGMAALLMALFLFLRELLRRPPTLLIGGVLALNGIYWVSGLANVSFWSAWWQGTYLLLSALLFAAMRLDEA